MNPTVRPDSISQKTRAENEAQGKGMKFYQMKRYRLKEGTKELQQAMEQADLCTNQLQAKKKKLLQPNKEET